MPVVVNAAPEFSALAGSTVVAIIAGAQHSLALCSDGTVVGWGDNRYKQLADASASQWDVPVAINAAAGVSALYGKTVRAIAAGYYHSSALCSDGTVAAWGLNNCGQLGDNTTITRSSPVGVGSAGIATNQRFARICGGPTAYHTLALVAAPQASEAALAGALSLPDSSFQFSFTNVPGAFFGVMASTNVTLQLSNWTPLGDATEVAPGQFQFTDLQATNSPQRFYRVRSP